MSNGDSFSFCKMKKTLEIDGSHDCTVTWMFFIATELSTKSSQDDKFPVM